jgi:septal ring-binding cell division protein DamX
MQPEDTLLKTALEKLRRQLEMDNIYLYRMQQDNAVYTVILYGAFTQRADALNALNSLPVEIKANQPYLRTLAGVKKSIELSQKNKLKP